MDYLNQKKKKKNSHYFCLFDEVMGLKRRRATVGLRVGTTQNVGYTKPKGVESSLSWPTGRSGESERHTAPPGELQPL